MLRLATLIANTDPRTLLGAGYGRHRAQMIYDTAKADVMACACIVADDVRQLVASGSMSIKSDDIHSVITPFDSTFIEFYDNQIRTLVGVLVHDASYDDSCMQLAQMYCARDGFLDEPTRVLAMLVFIRNPRLAQKALLLPMMAFVAIGKNGNVLSEWARGLYEPNVEIGEDVIAGIHTSAGMALLVLSFLGCKNVSTKEATGVLGASRQWRERHGQPRIVFHVLDINPMKKVLRTEGRIEANGLKKAMHICRGHFATYTEERPLFGKYAGRFWVPAHVKGSPEHGIVDKDYRIRIPGVTK